MGAGSHKAPSPGDGPGVSFSAAEVELREAAAGGGGGKPPAKPEPEAKKPRASWQPARRATGWGLRDPRRAADRPPLWKVRGRPPRRHTQPGPARGHAD